MKEISLKIFVITLSDRASKGEYEDRSGPRIREHLESYFKSLGWNYNIFSTIIPDDPVLLKDKITHSSSEFDLIFTTGGTGIGPRDITPEVVKPILDKEIPGIMEMIRIKYGMEKPNALLSRGVAGLIGNSIIFTLPGSLKAVNDYMTEIMKTLEHLIYMQRGIDAH